MPPVRSVRNQFHGINPHLHSLYQHAGGWGSFHTRHIVHLADALAAQLRPLGYSVAVEESLQLRRVDGGFTQSRPDVLTDAAPPVSGGPDAGIPVLEQTIPLSEVVLMQHLSDKPYRAIAIYEQREVVPLQPGRTTPVVWIELLSPSNKGSSEDAETYRIKRMNALLNGQVFVELDFLNETPPTFTTLPEYRRAISGQAAFADAFPYRILVIDPRPDVEQGQAVITRFRVDQPLPEVKIPLSNGDILDFDFHAPYQRTFKEGFFGDQVNYAELPAGFDRYSEADQTAIVRRLLAISQAVSAGVDLETASLPVNDIALADGLQQLEALRQNP